MKQIRICLDEYLEAREITRYELAKRTKMKYQNIDNYYKNKVIRYDREILLRICLALDCEVGDIIRVYESKE